MCDNDKIVDGIGYCGGIILSICLIPQILKIYKTKKVDNISLLWQLMYISGILLHLVYAFYYNLIPIYIPTIIELCLILFLIFLKILYRNNDIKKNETVSISI